MGHDHFIPQLKVADFGFARQLEAASLAETLCGSPLYMAPEILRYEKYDAKADLWSAGAVMFEMCVGKPPFRAGNHMELLRKIEKGKDQITFPDEMSDASLKKGTLKDASEERAPVEIVRPHTVSDDLKSLLRSLLKHRPIERISFEDFFHCEVIAEYKRSLSQRHAQGGPSCTSTVSSESSHQVAAQSAALADTALREDQQTESPSLQPTPSTQPQQSDSMRQRSVRPSYFTPRYVVGARSHAANVPADASEQHTTRPGLTRLTSAVEQGDGEASSLEDNVATPGSSMTHLPATTAKAPSPGATAVPTALQASKQGSVYDEEKGYVMVDKRNIDVHAVADELDTKARLKNERVGWGPLGVVRRPSHLGRLASLGTLSAATGPSPPSEAAQHGSSARNVGQTNTPAPLHGPSATTSPSTSTPPGSRFSSTPPNAPFALPPGARRPSFHRRPSQASEGSRMTPSLQRQQIAPRIPASAPSSANTNAAPHETGARTSAQPSSSPTPPAPPPSALARAISMASIRLFGVPTSMSMRGASARRSLRAGLLSSSPTQAAAEIVGASAGSGSIAEQNLLSLLHDYGQKSFVLSEFADAKLSVYYAEGPHQNNHTDARHAPSNSAANAFGAHTARHMPSTLASPSLGLTGTGNEGATPPSSLPSAGEIAACEALVLYVRSLSFLQRGIDAVRDYIEAHTGGSGRYTTTFIQPGPEINDTVQWLRAKFHDGYERASFARSKAAEEMPASAQNVDKMIFDKALEVARGAALDELERSGSSRQSSSGWNAEHCLLAYETANTMLMALLDPGEDGMALSSGAVATIEKFAWSITKRMTSLQRTNDPLLPSTR